jgi:hypothetical protein
MQAQRVDLDQNQPKELLPLFKCPVLNHLLYYVVSERIIHKRRVHNLYSLVLALSLTRAVED